MQIRSIPLGDLSGHRAGRLLLSQMYEAATGAPMPRILTGELGKPYFGEGALHFSISHTRDRVFCALADHPVGIDAEPLDRAIRLELANKILSPSELLRYQNAPDKRLALLRFWVLKEAQGKLTGKGVPIYPNHTDFSPDDPRIRVLDGCLVAVME